jgi:hypothetical protein
MRKTVRIQANKNATSKERDEKRGANLLPLESQVTGSAQTYTKSRKP